MYNENIIKNTIIGCLNAILIERN